MRNKLYEWLIGDATDCCYRSSLDYFTENAVILDVGIGNGVMVKDYHDAIKKKRLQIIGLDINSTYLRQCQMLVEDYDLSDRIKLYQQAVEAFNPHQNGSFDFIFFSMSFMLLKDQAAVLERVSNWLRPQGEIVFFQTMFKRRNRFIEVLKPRLKNLTTIDFGKMTYDADFYDLLEKLHFSVQMDRCMKRTWYNGTYRIISARPSPPPVGLSTHKDSANTAQTRRAT